MEEKKLEEFKKIEQLAKNGTWLYDLKDQLKDYVYGLSDMAFKKGDSDRDAISDRAALEKRQEHIKRSFIGAIGGIPEPSKDINAKLAGTVWFDGYRVEKIIYSPRENVYVTANMYIPDNIEGKTGAVLFVCGHWKEGKHAGEYQEVCQYLVRAGLVVFAQDPTGQGERFGYIDKKSGETKVNPCVEEHDYEGFQCMACGKWLARYFVHDSMRAIDYLCSRPEVDPEKIGITGNSGGGTQTSMMMLADRRLAAAAPATFVMNRKYYQKTGQAQDREQIWPTLSEAGIDHEDIVLSMAPKPVLILGVVHDFFPIEATEKTYRRCQRLWQLLKKPGNLERFYDDCDHHYTRKMARKAAAFFSRHLLGREIDPDAYVSDAIVNATDEKTLYCTPTGQVMSSFADAKNIYRENLAELQKLLGERAKKSDAERKEETAKFLGEQIKKNRSAPEGYFAKRWLGQTELGTDVGDLCAEGYLWMSQEEMINAAVVFKSKEHIGQKLPVTVAIWRGGSFALSEHADFIGKTCARGRAVLVFDMSASGLAGQRSLSLNADSYSPYGAIFKLNDDLIWLGDSIAALRVHDLLRLVDIIENGGLFESGDIEVYTHGRYSVYADIAKFLNMRIARVSSDLPLESYAEFVQGEFYEPYDIASVILPGLLEHADLDELRRWSEA